MPTRNPGIPVHSYIWVEQPTQPDGRPRITRTDLTTPNEGTQQTPSNTIIPTTTFNYQQPRTNRHGLFSRPSSSFRRELQEIPNNNQTRHLTSLFGPSSVSEGEFWLMINEFLTEMDAEGWGPVRMGIDLSETENFVDPADIGGLGERESIASLRDRIAAVEVLRQTHPRLLRIWEQTRRQLPRI